MTTDEGNPERMLEKATNTISATSETVQATSETIATAIPRKAADPAARWTI